MSNEISRVLNNLTVDEQQLRKAYDMPFLAHRQKEAREIIVTIQARIERLEKALEKLHFTASCLWGEVKGIRDIPGMMVTHPIIEEAKAALEEINPTTRIANSGKGIRTE